MKLRRALVAAGMAACTAAGMAAVGMVLTGCQDSSEDALSVVVTLPEHYVAGAAKATVAVDYSGTGAKILTEGGGVACAFILPGIDGDFVDDRKGTLTIHTNGARALRGPADIAACHMKASDADTTAADVHDKLLVKVAAAEDSAGKAIDLAAKGSKGHGGGGGATMTESAIEEAQQAAVKAAASSVPPTAPSASLGAPETAGANGSAMVKSPLAAGSAAGTTAGTAAASAAAAAAQKQAAARAASPGIVQNPVAAGRGAPADQGDGEGAPVTPDKDPSYDDSPSDDAKAPSYTLEFYVQSATRFGALQLEITHLGNSGGFIGRNDEVDCVSLVEAIVASNYLGERVTKIGLISLSGIQTPAAIMRCGFRTSEPLGPKSFAITVVDAADTKSNPLDPIPTVVISTVTPR